MNEHLELNQQEYYLNMLLGRKMSQYLFNKEAI